MKSILTTSLAALTFVGQVLTAQTLPVDAKTHKLSATKAEPRIQLARLPFTKSKEEKEEADKKGDKKDDKSDKSEKSEKSEKKDDKKVEKVEKSEKTEKTEKTEKAEKKGGFFGGKPKEEKKVEKTETKTETKVEKVVEEKPVVKATKEEKQTKEDAPKFTPDAALISILKDITKTLPQAGEEMGLTTADEKAIVEQARLILEKAISNEDLPNDRILAKGTDNKKSMQTEAWATGEVKVSDKLTGSVACVWGKRVKGLFTVTIAGESDKTVDNGSKVGEFIVVLTGKSPVQSGFDIQSQSEVNFWKGEVASVKVESACLPKEEASSDEEKSESKEVESKGAEPVKKKPLAILDSVNTKRIKQYQVELANYKKHEEDLAAIEQAKIEQEQKEAEEKLALADAEADKKAKAQESKEKEETEVAEKSQESKETKESKESEEKVAENKSDKSDKSEKTEKTEKTEKIEKSEKTVVAEKPVKTETEKTSIASINLPPVNSGRVWDNPAANSTIRQPSLEANLVSPERAIAGKMVTVSVVDKDSKPEPSVELSFNGATITTDSKGQANFLVPEDATPGRTLHISLCARPELTPDVVDILQPLMSAVDGQAPSIDRVSPLVSSNKQLIINGHDFEGMSADNHILIDNQFEAQVIAASPVQLHLVIPNNLTAGAHTVSVQNSGLRSNASRFEYITSKLSTDEKKGNLDKLTIQVQGTSDPVHIRVVNNSPDVIKINKGNNLLVTTSGGSVNSYVLQAKRLKKGDYKIDTKIEL
ncbi:MAG: IPT/TIG domain-containing protein [Candidatus Melainabacteria bacterium]|nr:MAG: IPT/TIG domain-containing protein [Candidatus Melainabacteria bacterium]